MLFSIDEDSGGRIEGWLMPDDPALTPSVIVHLSPEQHIVIEAFVFRPLLKEYGLHNTGICGFVLDGSNCPDLARAEQLEIYDADDHLLIYRRRPVDQTTDKKFFRLEPQLFRSTALDDIFLRRFHMTYLGLELLPEETTRSILAIPFTPSIYAAGRVFWRVWEPLLRDRGYRVGTVLRDPYHELAERLLILKLVTMPQGAHIATALGPFVTAAAAPLRDVDVKDPKHIENVLVAPPDELKGTIYNPLTRLLSAQNAFDPPPMPAIAVALDSLADMDAVGVRDDTGPFLETVSAILELPEVLPPVPLPTSQTVTEVATFLRGRPAANALIEMDLEVYQTVINAMTRARGQPLDRSA